MFSKSLVGDRKEGKMINCPMKKLSGHDLGTVRGIKLQMIDHTHDPHLRRWSNVFSESSQEVSKKKNSQ